MGRNSASNIAPTRSANRPLIGERLGVPVAASASWRFIIAFGATSAILLGTYYFPYAAGSSMRKLLDGYLRGYAAFAGAVLRIFETHLVVVGQDIVGRYSLRIIKTCDGMDVNILFASAVLAWPSALRRRIVAATLGLLILALANTARICSLFYVGLYAPASFEFVHIELWPAVILVLAVGLFVAFIANTRLHATS